MSVAPDLLLNTTAEIKNRNAPSQTPARQAEPSQNESSSFSQVYAKERQAQVAERRDAAAERARESQAKDQAVKEPAPEDAVAVDDVAESGNDLPEDEVETSALDPLLLFGMTGELPDAALAGQVDADAFLATANLQSSGPASLTEASFDPEQDALNQMQAVKMALNIGQQAQGKPGSPSAELSDDLLAQQLMADGADAEGGDLELTEFDLQGLSGKSLEALKEGTANAAPENFVSKLSALSQAVTQQASAARTPVVGQPVAMQQGGWTEAVVDRVMLMSSQNLKTAEIQLDPAELGRLDIRISVNQDQSMVTFASPHAGVREALDSQMHRLREMFAQQGMGQVDVNVSDQSPNRGWQGQESQAEGGQRGLGAEGGLADGEDAHHSVAAEPTTRASLLARSLVDYYA